MRKKTSIAAAAFVSSVALAALLAAPGAALAFGEVVRAGNITVTAVEGNSGACGLDFLISSSDDDHHQVEIDYVLEGTFSDGGNGQYRGSKSNRLITDVGPATYNTRYHRKPADMMRLICDNKWTYGSIRVFEKNYTAEARQREAERKGKQQAEIDERTRQKQEAEERKRRHEETLEDLKRQQKQTQSNNIAAYRRANPRCIVNEPADIARCEEFKRVEAQNNAREDARRAQEREKVERERQARADQERQFRESDRITERVQKDPCGVAAEQARTPSPYYSNPQQRAQVEAQRKEAQAALEKMCAQWKARGGSAQR